MLRHTKQSQLTSRIVSVLCLSALAALASAVLPRPARADLNYPDFNTISGLRLVGVAGHRAPDIIMNDGYGGNGQGAVWGVAKQRVAAGFSMAFNWKHDGRGIAFVVQNATPDALGAFCGFTGIPNSIAVSFERYHWVVVQSRGTSPNSDSSEYSLGQTQDVTDFTNYQNHTALIDYQPGVLRIYLDNVLVAPVLTVNVDIASLLSLDSGRAWVGLTGEGGAWVGSERLHSLSFVEQPFQPDLMLRNAGDSSYDGQGVINETGTATYQFRVANTVDASDTFVVKAPAGSGGWQVQYLSASGTDITAAVTSSTGWTSPSVAGNATADLLTAKVSPGTAPGGSILDLLIRATSNGDPSKSDAVRATTTMRLVEQPDLLVKSTTQPDTSYAANDVYQGVPVGDQIEAQGVASGGTASFSVKVQNDGNAPHAFVLRTEETGATGWTLTYRAGGFDISAAVRSAGGYATTSLAPGASLVVTVTAKPGTGIVAGASASAVLKAFLNTTETYVRDSVKVLAGVSVIDLHVKKASEADTAYAADNAYHDTPWGTQVETQAVNREVTATYQVRIQNDGATPVTPILKAVESADAGWTIVYTLDGTDVTTAMRSTAGCTAGALAGGATQVLSVAMTPGVSALGLTAKSVTVRAYLGTGQPVAQDAVSLVATVNAVHQPDLLIKVASEAATAYAANNVYQATPTGDQVKAQTATAAAPARYSVKVENDGSTPRTFFLRATESSAAGWSIVYKVGTNDITAALKGTGYTTETVAPGAAIVVDVVMTPTAAAGGTGKSTTLKAFLARGQIAVKDAVQAQALVPLFDKPDLLIKRSDEKDGAYGGGGISQASPGGDQVKGNAITAGRYVLYSVKLQNNGGNARSFLLKVREAVASGWRVTYKIGTADVSTQVRAANGFTTPVVTSGGSLVVTVAMVSTASAPAGSSALSTVRAFLDGADTTVRDERVAGRGRDEPRARGAATVGAGGIRASTHPLGGSARQRPAPGPARAFSSTVIVGEVTYATVSPRADPGASGFPNRSSAFARLGSTNRACPAGWGNTVATQRPFPSKRWALTPSAGLSVFT